MKRILFTILAALLLLTACDKANRPASFTIKYKSTISVGSRSHTMVGDDQDKLLQIASDLKTAIDGFSSTYDIQAEGSSEDDALSNAESQMNAIIVKEEERADKLIESLNSKLKTDYGLSPQSKVKYSKITLTFEQESCTTPSGHWISSKVLKTKDLADIVYP